MPAPEYHRRIVDTELDELMPSLAAIALEGAKGVGKTATASQRAATVHRLDDPAQRSILGGDPGRLTQGTPPVLIDEWQRVPESWDIVRRAVDDGAPAGSFLLTGSASPTGLPTHSGAARIVSMRMRPLTLAERGVGSPTVRLSALLTGSRPAIEGHTDLRLADYVEEIVASGFPGLRGLGDRALRAQLDGYLLRIVERDFPELGHTVRNPVALRRWLSAYAAASSTTASYETIRDAATSGQGEKPAKSTTIPIATYSSASGFSTQYPPGSPSATVSRGYPRRRSTNWSTRRSPRGCSESARTPCSTQLRPSRRSCATARCSARSSSRS